MELYLATGLKGIFKLVILWFSSVWMIMFPKIMKLKQKSSVRLARFLAIVWVILSLAETGVTYLSLNNVDNIEGNPFARSLLLRDEALFYGVKFLVTVAVGLGFWMLATRTKHLRAMVACEILLLIIFIGVLGNNLTHL